MSKINKYFIAATIILLAVIIILAVKLLVFNNQKSAYSAVYLDSGDIYFGKLHRFPKTYLTEVYLLQRNNDVQTSEATPYILSKFADSMWGPKDYITINRSKIIWIGQLKSDSAVAKAINNPSDYIIGTTTTVPIIPKVILEK